MSRPTRRVASHRALVGGTLLVLLAAGEADSANTTGAPKVGMPQIWLCGREHTNSARGYHRRGIVLDTRGHLWRYGFSKVRVDPWLSSDLANISEEALLLRYRAASVSAEKVPLGEISRLLPLIVKAAKARPTKARSAGADRGSDKLYCLTYDSAKRTYEQVLLDEKGDWERTNRSEAAKTLMTWLNARLGKLYY